MKLLTLSLFFLTLLACGSKSTATPTPTDIPTLHTNCQQVEKVLKIIVKNNFFELSSDESIKALSSIYKFLPSNAAANEINQSYALEPIEPGWSKATSMHYTSDTKDGSTVFQSIEISIEPDCFDTTEDLMVLATSHMGKSTIETPFDSTFGAMAEWIYPSEDVDSENAITIQSGENYQRIRIEMRPAPTEPFWSSSKFV